MKLPDVIEQERVYTDKEIQSIVKNIVSLEREKLVKYLIFLMEGAYNDGYEDGRYDPKD